MERKFLKKYACLAAACILFLLITGNILLLRSRRLVRPLERSEILFDTVIAISLYDRQSREIMEGAFELCRHFEEEFSPTVEGGALWRMNHRGQGVTEWRADPELLKLVKKGLEYSEETRGAFDFTVLPVSALWDFRSGETRLPDAEALAEALAEVDYRKVSVEGDLIRFADDRVQLDPGALAKGYIADRLKEYLEAQGVRRAIINLGGNVLCIGEKAKGKPFQIAIRKPEERSSEAVKVLGIKDLSVVSSGIYERGFTLDGVRYHHILNPQTGMPYQNGLSAITIVGPSSCECDALSTACFSLGETEGMKLLDTRAGYYGYFIRADGTIIASAAAPQ